MMKEQGCFPGKMSTSTAKKEEDKPPQTTETTAEMKHKLTVDNSYYSGVKAMKKSPAQNKGLSKSPRMGSQDPSCRLRPQAGSVTQSTKPETRSQNCNVTTSQRTAVSLQSNDTDKPETRSQATKGINSLMKSNKTSVSDSTNSVRPSTRSLTRQFHSKSELITTSETNTLSSRMSSSKSTGSLNSSETSTQSLSGTGVSKSNEKRKLPVEVLQQECSQQKKPRSTLGMYCSILKNMLQQCKAELRTYPSMNSRIQCLSL